jgi:hypothetical protein
MKTTQLHGTAVFITPVSCEKERYGIMLKTIIKVTDKQIAASILPAEYRIAISKYTSKNIVIFIIISLFRKSRMFLKKVSVFREYKTRKAIVLLH